MPGEAAGAELPLPEAGGPGSRTGETAPAPLSGPLLFSGFLLHPSASSQSPPRLSRLVLPRTCVLLPHPQDFMKAWRPQTASSKPEAMKGSVLAFHSRLWQSVLFGPSPICLGLCTTSRSIIHRELCPRTDSGGQVWKREGHRYRLIL